MKKTLTSVGLALIVLAGCSRNSEPRPTPVPSEAVSPSTIPTAVPATPSWPPTSPAVPTVKPPTARPTIEPTDPLTVNPTTTGADTPANAFAKRWGERYPQVPEYAILKAANGVCDTIADSPDWINDTPTVNTVKDITDTAGIDSNDSLEFGQDAQQNYCASA